MRISDWSSDVCSSDLMPVQRPYNPNARRMAELIQADWAKVGVQADIVSYEWGEHLERSRDVNRKGAVLLGWTGAHGAPAKFLPVLLDCEAVGGAHPATCRSTPTQDWVQNTNTAHHTNKPT